MATDLRIDWATHEAAKHACEKWHYSRSFPAFKVVKVGAWEGGRFIGVVLFSRGANQNLLKPFGLDQTEGCELTRVALRDHETPVSRVVAVALRFLRKQSPGLRLVVSFADPSQGHHGGIYQAGGWIYTGRQPDTVKYLAPDGKQWHSRMVSKDGWTVCDGVKRKVWKHSECQPVTRSGKHRYLMPLDPEMRASVAHLAKPYPKRPKQATGGTTAERQCNADPDAPSLPPTQHGV